MKTQDGYTRMSKVYFALCKSIDTPVSLGAWLRFKHNQLALAEMEIAPGDYLDADAFRLDYLVVSFMSKWKGLSTGLDLEAEAIRKFTTSEELCKLSNERIKLSRVSAISPNTSAIIHMAARKIARLLGDFDWEKIEPGFGWGPGATTDVSRRRAFVDTKLCELPISVTRRALPIFRKVLSSDLHWSAVVLGCRVDDLVGPFSFLDRDVFNLTEECIIDTVPKNAKTHRVIAKEPRANGFLQKGIGSYIRRRLRRVGIDLDHQEPNQIGAACAYTDGLATLDLKAASDSMPIELIFELLPVDWAFALNDLRSHRAVMPDGSKITLQKFSSMGNGFTFELETLVFWALSSSVMSFTSPGARVLVYGDDIIVPSVSAEMVVDTLAFVGFQVNKEKSFITGNFYESCGKHYFKGEDVTPIYQKELVTEEVELLRCANRIIRYAYRAGKCCQLRKELSAPWHEATRYADTFEVFQIPLGEQGDDGFVVPGDYFTRRPHDPNRGIRCRVIEFHPKRLVAHEGALLAWSLRRGVITKHPYEGFVTSSPDTTSTIRLTSGFRWVMPSGEFGSNW
jgi:hypothetical protein